MTFQDEGKPQPAGTQFLGLISSLIDIFREPGVSDVEVMFTTLKADEKGEHIVEEGQKLAQTQYLGIKGLNDQVKEKLRSMYEAPSGGLISLMVLWMRSDGKGGKKLGIQKFAPIKPGPHMPKPGEYESWEKEAISDYVRRRVSQ
jgi:hypothetical protein